jgi:hypothetical protein
MSPQIVAIDRGECVRLVVEADHQDAVGEYGWRAAHRT